jgi:DNA-binding CsgD family transcriptional regulator
MQILDRFQNRLIRKQSHLSHFAAKTSQKERVMSLRKGNNFSTKHGPDEKPDTSIKNELLKQTKNEKVPCAVAFEIAKALQISPETVGKTADLMNFKLTKCELGLFGYKPKKKIVKSQESIKVDVKDAVSDAIVQGRLSCERAWDIASRLQVSKMTVSGACEAMGIKIKDCQLGAF